MHHLLHKQRKFKCRRERAKQVYLHFIHNSPICNTRYFQHQEAPSIKYHSSHKRHSKPNIMAFLKHTHFASHLTNFMSLTKIRVLTCDLHISIVFKTNYKNKDKYIPQEDVFIQLKSAIKSARLKFSTADVVHFSQSHKLLLSLSFKTLRKHKVPKKQMAIHHLINSSKRRYPTTNQVPNLIIKILLNFPRHAIFSYKLKQTKSRIRNPEDQSFNTHYKQNKNEISITSKKKKRNPNKP